ncbi:hypothetical protein [Catenuloplanes indicus]|uniref:Uncharacterized protein n=1 Tax=Catenuloplanes indicus TaxID=137267 RepID=A0AAE3W7I7_9ACTN|nr:hypothetical protein [Catenuloplanes indicus]MDQ0370989.1 hypothetical protein [Catenuloplanes indicus]
MITAGTVHRDGERVFRDVRDATRAVAVELDDDYARLVIEVADPPATADLIERGRRRPTSRREDARRTRA